ncbi:MAG TPA: HlyD family secretion protein [Steroidobacteraceae bacterium]|jgi:membrane fusion protein (multidrug efflux system)|nr:HlyD family secretion protein [Steroidobacteraceae bacterium]
MIDDEPVTKTRLQRLRWPLMILAPVVVIAGILYFYITGGRYQSTDDAYTRAATVSISANVAGRVVEVDVRDNELVQRGATLFKLDDAPFRIAVNDATARLASTRLQVESLKSTYRQRQVELRAARDTQHFAQTQFDRQSRLVASGISSRTQFDQASHALDAARQDVANVQQQIGVALANLGGNPDIAPERHPLVEEAQAALDRAQLNLSYTVVKAPIDGVVTRVEQLQTGDYIAASAAVFALVATHDTWIEANFKEVQLAHMRPGQTATVRIDRFPGRKFSAQVVSLSPGTGSQFSLLPPENATGNWVKVVQRVPVRLHLTGVDPGFLLQAGLSADVKVDTQSRDDARASPEVAGTAH